MSHSGDASSRPLPGTLLLFFRGPNLNVTSEKPFKIYPPSQVWCSSSVPRALLLFMFHTYFMVFDVCLCARLPREQRDAGSGSDLLVRREGVQLFPVLCSGASCGQHENWPR